MIEKCWENVSTNRPTFDEIFDKLSGKTAKDYFLDNVDGDEFKMYVEDIVEVFDPSEILVDKLSKYKNEINNLKSREENMKNEIKNLKSREENMRNEIKNLKSREENTKKEIKNLKSREDNMKNEIKNLKSREENMKNEIKDLKNEINDLRKQEEILKKDNKELKEKNDIAESIANKHITNIRWKDEFMKMRLHYEQQLQLFFDEEDFQPTPYLTNEEEKIYNIAQK